MTLPSTEERPTLAARISPRLSWLVRGLARAQRQLHLEELTALVGASGVRRADVAPYLSLHATAYSDQQIYRSSLVELGCIGWRPGQHTPVHHHAGSACCVLVLDGVLTNLEYADADPLLALQERTLHAGELLAYRGHELHRMLNDAANGSTLFTLHVYSPPLAPMSHRVSSR